MPLTPQEIQDREFREAFRGYNQADVDLFLDQVTEEYTHLFEENQRLKARIAGIEHDPETSASAGAAGDAASRSLDELRKAEAEIRSRLRRFLQEQLAQLDAAERGSGSASRTAQSSAASRSNPSTETSREFWERE